MKKLIVYFILFHLSFFAFSQNGWSVVPIRKAYRYDDIFFINDSVGWATNSVSDENVGRVFKTTNGGKTWLKTGLVSDNYLRSIEFFDANVGICGSFKFFDSPEKSAALYRTTDGGATWTDVAPGIGTPLAGVCGLAKADENTMYGVGVWSEPAFLIKSIDKGLTWTYTDMSAYASLLIDVFFLDANHGFVTGAKSFQEGGVILYTADGGQTWEEKFVTNRRWETVWKIQTPDSVHFYGAIEGFVQQDAQGNQIPTHMLRSSDGGQTWEEKTVYEKYHYIQVIGFMDEKRGWTGGRNALFETQDGGDTWGLLSFGTQHNRFFKVNKHTAFMTGEQIYKYNSTLNHSDVSSTEKHDPVHLLTVSPNPAQREATIRAILKKPTYAQIFVYGLTDNRTIKLFNGLTHEGEKKITLDMAALPSQIYLVFLKTNEGLITEKVVKK